MLKPFPHIPMPSESYAYFAQWLQGNPLDDGISQFFNELFDIGEVIEVVSIEPLDADGVRTTLRCRDHKLQKITECFVDISFGDNPYIDTEFGDFSFQLTCK